METGLQFVSVSSWCRESISAENSYTGEDRLEILEHTMSDVFSISLCNLGITIFQLKPHFWATRWYPYKTVVLI